MFCFIALCLLPFVLCDNWAAIIAGSLEFYNYRHQADAYHARKILSDHGIPNDHLIMFVYNDIAFSSENPYPGNIINKPGGPNLYVNLDPDDYTGDKITPSNLINALTNKSTIGKNINSTINDNVFIYFVDHGAPGLFGLPGGVLYAHDLQVALKQIVAKNIVIYMESCESGSMFNNWLSNNSNIFVMTASSPTESSWACYWDEDRQTYLGDVFSVNWLQNSDTIDLTSETIYQQFIIDKNETNTSTVCHYGNTTIAKTSLLSDFMGNVSINNNITNKVPITETISSYRASLMTAYKRLGRWITTDLAAIDIGKLQADVNQLNVEINQMIKASHFVKEYGISSRKGGCHSNEILNSKCLKYLVNEYFDGTPTVYDFEALSVSRPCS